MKSRSDEGKYKVFTNKSEKGQRFGFTVIHQKKLTQLLQDKTWKPRKIEFSFINFTVNTASLNVYKELQTRTDLQIIYTNCILPKKIKEQTVDIPMQVSVEANTHSIDLPSRDLTKLQTQLDQGIAFYNDKKHTLAIECFDNIIKLFDISKKDYDENIWRFLLDSYHYRALALSEIEFGLSEPNKEICIYAAWKCFLNITKKNEQDFSNILSISKLIVFTNDPILALISSMIHDQLDLVEWKNKFDQLVKLSQDPHFPNQTFVINFIQGLITHPDTLNNQSLKIYLTDKTCLSDLTNNLHMLIAIQTFYAPLLNQPGNLFFNLMNEMESHRTNVQRLQLENEQLKSSQNNHQKPDENINEEEKKSQYKNSSVLYRTTHKKEQKTYLPTHNLIFK